MVSAILFGSVAHVRMEWTKQVRYGAWQVSDGSGKVTGRLSVQGSACAHKGGEGDADIRVAEMIPATELDIVRPQWRKPEGPRQQTSKLFVVGGK
jgi:hypothetical protein